MVSDSVSIRTPQCVFDRRKLLFHGGRHRAHFVAGLLERYATLQPADDAERMVARGSPASDRSPSGRKTCASAVAAELRSSDLAERPRHDADDSIAFAVERDRAPDDVGVAAEPTAPERFAQHDDAGTARLLVFRPEGSAGDRRDPQHAKERGRHEAGAQQLRVPVVRERSRPCCRRRRSPRSSSSAPPMTDS